MIKSIIFLFFITSILLGHAQQMENLRNFDKRKYHFGFALGYNKSDFYLDRDVSNSFKTDSLLVLEVNQRPGFNLGIVSSLPGYAEALQDTNCTGCTPLSTTETTKVKQSR